MKKYPILGSHVGVNKNNNYLIGAAEQAINDGGNTFMIYTGPPQNTLRKNVDEFNLSEMKEILIKNNIDIKDLVVHAPYLINISNPVNEQTWKFGVDFLQQEIERCEKIGINILVLHPGSFTKGTSKDGIEKLIQGLNIVLKKQGNVKIAIETMSGKGTEVGTTIEELSYVLSKVENKERIGICIDTCHMNDAGYNLKDWAEIKNAIKNSIGLEKILVFHINDSKNPINSHKDRHENIGYGTIGFDVLNNIVWDEDFKEIPKILETPYIGDHSPYKQEIKNFREQLFDNKLEILREK
ncbi:endonuclease IV [Williamsoniiplasma somnilux]|uniref:Probable endonuclease 4 n=1 Tax=Williamsoniiplasma somnilux TaxID=215578 RepID=A0A2K8NYX2_9MOLU|nr:deoxyribonuclease IV [Williamsoniiplasma somnilux]ATZ18756.1 endonuclease IV [Williamsoniiplasma somnilux]